MCAKKKNEKNKTAVRVVSVLLLIICWAWFVFSAPTNNKEKVFLSVGKGETVSSVGDKLKENNIIRNKSLFCLFVRIMGADGKIKSGTHLFKGSMPLSAVVKELTKNHSLSKNLTVPEGWTVAQIQNKLNTFPSEYKEVKSGFSDRALNVSVKTYEHLYGDSCEGYLFPDTYSVEAGITSKELIDQMLKKFDSVQIKYMSEIIMCGEKYFHTDDYNESLYKVLTVASLIEREAKTDGDRDKIASVIYNRLAVKMPLQIDATITYEPGKSTTNNKKLNTKRKTPYNTYVIKGLPKGPICNPGEKSIAAAVRPAKTDYIYYVAKKDGSHVFAKTYEEHKKNIRKFK